MRNKDALPAEPAHAGFACPYLERGLQQEALLCIHELCLAATQPKQGDVKQVGGTQEAAKAGGQAARLHRMGRKTHRTEGACNLLLKALPVDCVCPAQLAGMAARGKGLASACPHLGEQLHIPVLQGHGCDDVGRRKRQDGILQGSTANTPLRSAQRVQQTGTQ